MDAGAFDGGPDAGPLCNVGGCDDGNVCTDDVCNPAIGCVHTPVSGTCDDGVLCNGADSCGEGTCSVHDGVDPCPGSSYCDAASDSCMGCEDDGDCPAEMPGDWGVCTFPSNVCVRAGTRARTVRSYTCSAAGTCEPADRAETEACMRETDGVSCGTPTVGAWSACTYADATCSTTGTRTRSVTTRVCGAGTCQTMTMVETDTAGCARSTNGTACGTPVNGSWSTCGSFADVCDESGTQSRSVTQPVCAAGTCSGTMLSSENRACTRDTDGDPCGTGSAMCTDWSTCMLAGGATATDTCSGDGQQVRLCTGSACAAGTCNMSARTLETQSCTLGGACVASVADCGACQALIGTGCPSGAAGYRECTASTGTCNGGGNCVTGGTATVYEACTCP